MIFPDEPGEIYYLATKDLRLATKAGGEVKGNDAVYTKITYLATGTRAWKVSAKGKKDEPTAAKAAEAETAEAPAPKNTVCTMHVSLLYCACVLIYDACVLTPLCLCPYDDVCLSLSRTSRRLRREDGC